jgi:ATPase subunit of ABC transporter with duplicated ATPase domains
MKSPSDNAGRGRPQKQAHEFEPDLRLLPQAKPLFPDISVKFGGGNRYGSIRANGCGKSTFMKILGSELEPSTGSVASESN